MYCRMLREAINDATDLVKQRRKAPHTRLDTWKVAKVGSLPYTFLDPMIPCKSHIHALLQQQQQQHSLFSQASWGRLEMKPERNKFKVQAH